MRRLSILALLLAGTGHAAAVDDNAFTALAKECDSNNTSQACAASGDYLWNNNGRKLTACPSESGIVCIRPNEDRKAAVGRIDRLAYQFHEKACGLQHADACMKAGAHFAAKYGDAPEKASPHLAPKLRCAFGRPAISAPDKGAALSGRPFRPSRGAQPGKAGQKTLIIVAGRQSP
jgi:hypothetical protein